MAHIYGDTEIASRIFSAWENVSTGATRKAHRSTTRLPGNGLSTMANPDEKNCPFLTNACACTSDGEHSRSTRTVSAVE